MKQDIFIDMAELKAELEGTQYHELKDKFDALGVPKAWKAGTGKLDLVAKAVAMYKGIYVDKKHKDEDEFLKAYGQLKGAPKKGESAKPKKTVKAEEVEQAPAPQEREEVAPLSLKAIEKNLYNIKMNLFSAKGAKRTALLNKRNELQDMRDEYYG